MAPTKEPVNLLISLPQNEGSLYNSGCGNKVAEVDGTEAQNRKLLEPLYWKVEWEDCPAIRALIGPLLVGSAVVAEGALTAKEAEAAATMAEAPNRTLVVKAVGLMWLLILSSSG